VASLIAATVLLTVSELFTSTAQWGLQYGLSPRHAQGEYGAVFSIGYTVQSVIGPVALTSLMENAGTAGWLLIAVLFAVLAVATAPAVRWAIATRPKEPQDPTETGSRTAARPACSRAAAARPSAGSMCVDRPASGPADNACPTAADPAAAARRTHRQRTPITHPGAAPPPQPHQGKRSTTTGDHPT
jgi:MFS family permease